MVVDVPSGERAEGSDGSFGFTKIGEHPGHESVGHPAAPKPWIGLDVRNHESRPVGAVVGDRDDLVVDHEFVPLTSGVVAHRVLHAAIVSSNVAPTAVSTA